MPYGYRASGSPDSSFEGNGLRTRKRLADEDRLRPHYVAQPERESGKMIRVAVTDAVFQQGALYVMVAVIGVAATRAHRIAHHPVGEWGMNAIPVGVPPSSI